MSYFLQKEDSDYLLLETGDHILLEEYQEPLTIETNPATSITPDGAMLNGTILSGSPAFRCGFEYNTVPAPDQAVEVAGTFSPGVYGLSIDGLTPSTTYYFRAFAENGAGIVYGGWGTFTTLANLYQIMIGGIDRTADVLDKTPNILDALNDQQNTCSFQLVDRSGNGIPDTDEEIIIIAENGTKHFAGTILTVNMSKKRTGVIVASVRSIDYARLFDSFLVHRTFQNMTDKEIIEDIVATYCPGFGITTNNVVEGVTISQISFNYLQPTQCMRKICDLTGRNWYIDYDKDIHYFPIATSSTPFDITETSNKFFDLTISKDSSQVRNRVYVRGGTELSEFTMYETKGDGVKRQFVLPDKPHEVTIQVNGVPKTLGIKNINLSGFDYYLNYQEKYVEQDSGLPVLTDTDVLSVTYKYDIPILVAVEDHTSIDDLTIPGIPGSGVKEFAIFDKSITTTAAARARAQAELTDYALNMIEGSFYTYEIGFFSGQTININHSEYGVNADYIVTRVNAQSMGGGLYVYQVSIASAKTMGIIRFLIELLEANKSSIELSDDEVVDELFTLTDSLLADSLTDALLIDSTGPYFTWCPDSLTSSPITRARWDLFQWG